jgi:hypothetical protein
MCVPRKSVPFQPTQTAPGQVDVVDGTTFKSELGLNGLPPLLDETREIKILMHAISRPRPRGAAAAFPTRENSRKATFTSAIQLDVGREDVQHRWGVACAARVAASATKSWKYVCMK